MLINEDEEQYTLASTMEEMQNYLERWMSTCESLPEALQEEDKSRSLEALSHILDGLSYYLKLLKSASTLLSIDSNAELWNSVSVFSLSDDMQKLFASIYEALENEDYSLMADLAEYELAPAISMSQQVLKVLLQHCSGRS